MVTKGGGRELAEGMAGEENKQLDRRGRKERRGNWGGGPN